jgi:D-alanyl-D-alanine carboxypeptidase
MLYAIIQKNKYWGNKMHKSNLLKIITMTLAITFAQVGLADDLDLVLQTDINNYVQQYSAAEGNTAIQLSVLLPNEMTSRDYIAGTQMKETATAATTGMLVQWGSITKEFTNLLLFQYLYHQHRSPQVFLKQTLVNILPEHFASGSSAWPATWRNITIEQLMNMTSGIPDYISFPGVDLSQITDLESIVAPIAAFQKRHRCQQKMGCFPAGQGWNYSNTNYIILGMIVEKLYAKNFSTVIQQKILSKIQRAKNNVVYQTPYTSATLHKMINGYCMGSWPSFTPGQNVTNVNLNIAASAGALTGNTHTLVEMIYALFHDQFLPHTQMQFFTRTGWVRKDNHQFIDINSDTAKHVCKKMEDCFGLGLMVTYSPMYGKIWEYAGGTMGYITDYIWLPQENVIIAFSRNSSANIDNLLITLHGQILQAVCQHLHSGKSS